MENRTRARWALIGVLLTLLTVSLSSGLPDLAPGSLAAADSASPTAGATAAVATATVAVDEQDAATALENQVVKVYNESSPAVVNITNRTYVYYRFMGRVPEEGTGSGFVYDTEGHIVTNYHVIENAEELVVTLAGGQVYDATIVGMDPVNDLAVIEIDAGSALPAPLVLGDSDRLRVGQFVVAIGNPYGLQQTLTTGVVSALGRIIESPEDDQFIGEAIQTDAAINPGNSGGPLLNLQGRVVGVNSQIVSPSGASAGIGFAVSAETVKRVVPALIEDGHYAHPWLGADLASLTASISGLLRQAGADLAVDSGVLVIDVARGGPADQAGLLGGSRWVRVGRYQVPLGGDVITAVDGRAVTDLQALTVYLETAKAVGDRVELTVLRSEQELQVVLTLGEQQ